MASPSLIPSGDFRTSYAADTTDLPDHEQPQLRNSWRHRRLPCADDLSNYWLSISIQIEIFAIASTGFEYSCRLHRPDLDRPRRVFSARRVHLGLYLQQFADPGVLRHSARRRGDGTGGSDLRLAGRTVKGALSRHRDVGRAIYLLDFFSRAEWFSGGSVPASANPFSIFGYTLRGDRQYFYVVLAYLVISFLLVTNLMRTRDGRALVAIRDHYLSAEIMGINLTKYRTLSFGLAAFFAGIAGALYAHYQLVISQEGFGIDRSILFLAMIIIGGTGSIMGTLMGTAFVVLLPESIGVGEPASERQRDRSRVVAQQQHHFSARDHHRADHHRVPDVRARRARAPLAPDQNLLETLPVFTLRLERDRLQ